MKNKFIFLLIFFIWVLTACVAFSYLFSSNIPFWFDPARDMLSAWANLHKVTLIGPPSGIPGFFYGPYWVWWLSFALLLSKDPAVVAGLTMTIPYFVIFFGVLLAFGNMFGKTTSVFLWLLFFISFQGYMTQLWNPYLAPIFFLSILYILVFFVEKLRDLKSALPLFIAGLLTGIALNIHISFSVGFSIGCILYLCMQNLFFLRQKNIGKQLLQAMLQIGSFLLGIVIVFFPFFLFEVRHGFTQTKVAWNAFVHGGNVVLQHGFTHQEIIAQALLRFAQLIRVPLLPGIVVLVIGLVMYVYVALRHGYANKEKERNLILLLLSIIFCIMAVYLLAKNPIWDYHFDGFEVLWLLLLGVVVSRIKVLSYLLIAWTIFLCVVWSGGFVSSLYVNPLSRGSLYTKEYIVHTIQQNAGKHEYTVFVYNPAIYTYEYNYLFRWITGNEFSYDPGQIQRKGIVYIVLPQAKEVIRTDFIHFHTPDRLYKTTKTWQIPDGTTILKRERING